MDKLKICLQAGLVAAAAQGFLAGCTARVPTRHPAADTLVRAGELEVAANDGRRDASLGRNRSPMVRSVTGSTEYTYDRQRVIDGRPYADYRITTRTRSALER